MTQNLLAFDRPLIPPVICAPFDYARLTGQNLMILERLRKWPASNLELARLPPPPEMIMRVAARVHDLKRFGFRIESEHVEGGKWVYKLTGEPPAKGAK